jgi:hypothetical protein
MVTQHDPNQSRKDSDNAQTKRPRNDLKEEQGGPQTDQRVGETDKGSHNQEAKGRNPQSNKAEQ